MKTLWGILVVVSIAVVFALGITNVSTELFSAGGLSDDSIKLVNSTNPIVRDFYDNVTTNLNSSQIDTDGEPDLNGISEFFQEFKTFQNKYDQLKGGLKTIYSLRDWFIIVIPFTDADDLGIFIYLYRALVWVLMIIIFVKVLKGGQID